MKNAVVVVSEDNLRNIIYSSLSKEKFVRAGKAALLLEKADMEKYLKLILGRCLDNGLVRESVEVKNLIRKGSVLSKEEIFKILDLCEKRNKRETAIEACNLLSEPERTRHISKLIDEYLEIRFRDMDCLDYKDRDFLYFIENSILLLPESPNRISWLNNVLNRHIKKGRLEESCRVAKFLGRKLTTTELIKISRICREKRKEGSIKAIGMLEVQVRAIKIREMLDRDVFKSISDRIDLILLLPEPERTSRTDEIFKECLDGGHWVTAIDNIALCPDSIRVKWANQFLNASYEKGYIGNFDKLVVCLPEEEKVKWLNIALERYIIDDDEKGKRRIIKLFPEKTRKTLEDLI